MVFGILFFIFYASKYHIMLILLAVIICLVFIRRDTAILSIFKGIIDKFFPTRRVFETAAEVAARDVPLESHFVTTSDGYVLNVFRIFHKLPAAGQVVLLQHGMLSNSSDWVAVDQSIAFRLVDKGWDVWLGNNRGNVYCREHVAFPSNSRSFNSYSYHEIGLYDLPAVVDYIRQKTNRQKIVYIGHSQGNSQFFAMMSLLPEMADKILVMFALAPVSSLAHSRTKMPFMYKLAVLVRAPRRIFEVFGIHRISTYFPRFLLPLVDLTSPVWSPIGNYAVGHRILNLLTSYACPSIICNSFEYFFLFRIRNGATWQELEHYSQSLSGKHHFNQFDYGPVQNMEVYGQPYPKPYNVRKIKTHVSLVWGQNDAFVAPVDLVRLLDSLKRKTILRVPNYKHLDFIASVKHNDLILAHIYKITEMAK